MTDTTVPAGGSVAAPELPKPKFCRDCRFIVKAIAADGQCSHHVVHNLVTGAEMPLYCKDERGESGGCGPDAYNFQPAKREVGSE